MAEFKDAQQAMLEFRDERDWKQYHNPKDLAISISLEAAELLEIFQWSGSDTQCAEKRRQIKEELADIMLYAISLADVMDMEIPEILLEKLELNRQKYPVSKVKGQAKKYTELD